MGVPDSEMTDLVLAAGLADVKSDYGGVVHAQAF
jgi:hypothetical protein